MKEKTPLSHEVLAFRCLILRPQNLILRSQNQICGKLLLSRKLRYFKGSRFSHVLYYQQLSIASYRVIFYANKYFELLPIVSTAFKACQEPATFIMKENGLPLCFWYGLAAHHTTALPYWVLT